MDLKGMRGSTHGKGPREQVRSGSTDDPRKSAASKVFMPTGKSQDHDKILEYGAQLNDIALQLQEWVSIYNSQGGGDGQVFSISHVPAAAMRQVKQLKYADGQVDVPIAFGRSSTDKLRSSRSAGRSPLRSSRGSAKRRSRSASRSKSREGKKFIQRIEKLRMNLEVEGQAI